VALSHCPAAVALLPSPRQLMQFPPSWLALLKPKRIRRRRGESAADTRARHFRELEARYRAMGLAPRRASAAAMKEMLTVLNSRPSRR
jgi:hypothetical protein